MRSPAFFSCAAPKAMALPPAPPTASAGGDSDDTEFWTVVEPPKSFQRADLEEIRPSSVGGKAACQWQRRLREQCIRDNVAEIDITNDLETDWRQVLASSQRDFAELIIGAGILAVVFRIIDTERDSNYSPKDNRGRHYFEFRRTDSSLVRLHYHKQGDHDRPIVVPPPLGAAQPDVPHGGAGQPALPAGGADEPLVPGGGDPGRFTLDHLDEAARSRFEIGRPEARDAFQTLLKHYHGDTAPGAVDITDCSTFDWLRWLSQLNGAHDVIRKGVYKVCVVRWEQDGEFQAVFCHLDKTYTTLVPRDARYRGSTVASPFVNYRESNWATEPLLSAARVAATPWMLLREELVWH